MGATDGKGRDHDVAPRQRLAQHRLQLGDRLVPWAMFPIAVGRFDPDDVGFRNQRWIAHQGPPRHAQIPAEHPAAQRPVAALELQLEDGRPQDVPGVMKPGPNTRHHGKPAPIIVSLQPAQALLCLRHRVERRIGDHQTAAGTMRLFREPLPFLFLDVGAVEQHHPQQIGGRLRHMDRRPCAQGHQTRQQAGMIQMRMGDDHRLQRPRIEREGFQVLARRLAPSLEHAALDEKLAARRRHVVTRPRDLLHSPEETHLGKERKVPAQKMGRLATAPFSCTVSFMVFGIISRSSPFLRHLAPRPSVVIMGRC